MHHRGASSRRRVWTRQWERFAWHLEAARHLPPGPHWETLYRVAAGLGVDVAELGVTWAPWA